MGNRIEVELEETGKQDILGGILLGVRDASLELSLILEREFYIKFHLRDKSDKFRWILMAVYGPAQDDHKAAFLAELKQQRKIIKDIYSHVIIMGVSDPTPLLLDTGTSAFKGNSNISSLN
ncbi:hypothetical protein ACJX0J_034300 [Zea mays]